MPEKSTERKRKIKIRPCRSLKQTDDLPNSSLKISPPICSGTLQISMTSSAAASDQQLSTTNSECSSMPATPRAVSPANTIEIRSDPRPNPVSRSFNTWLNDVLDSSKRSEFFGFGHLNDADQEFPANSPFYADRPLSRSGESSPKLAPPANADIVAERSTISSPGSRFCISCGVTKTPYWRDSWSPSLYLCNACGLRFAKFKKHCSRCGYVPRKDNKGGRVCPQCDSSWS